MLRNKIILGYINLNLLSRLSLYLFKFYPVSSAKYFSLAELRGNAIVIKKLYNMCHIKLGK